MADTWLLDKLSCMPVSASMALWWCRAMGFSFAYTTNSVSDEDAVRVIDKVSR